jgi:hypothetical protein
MPAPEDSHAASPAHSKVVASGKARPFASSVAIVHYLAPASHVRLTSQSLAPAALTKVEHILHEETVTISDGIWDMASACCFDNSPSISRVGTSVPEQHPSMTPALKHFKSHEAPPCAQMPSSLTVAPSMQAVVVDGEPIVDPQLAPIIGDDAELVMSRLEDSQPTCPTNRKVIASGETRPSATSVAVVDSMPPTSHVRPAPI